VVSPKSFANVERAKLIFRFGCGWERTWDLLQFRLFSNALPPSHGVLKQNTLAYFVKKLGPATEKNFLELDSETAPRHSAK
jgi:hypothetical protein